jgi:hypothetical protein
VCHARPPCLCPIKAEASSLARAPCLHLTALTCVMPRLLAQCTMPPRCPPSPVAFPDSPTLLTTGASRRHKELRLAELNLLPLPVAGEAPDRRHLCIPERAAVVIRRRPRFRSSPSILASGEHINNVPSHSFSYSPPWSDPSKPLPPAI